MKRSEIFISHSIKDSKWKDRLLEHLAPIIPNKNNIPYVDNQMVRVGENWDEQVQQRLDISKIIIAIVSVHFFNSDYIFTNELPKTVERAKLDGAKLILVKVGDCVFPKNTQLDSFQAAHDLSKPLNAGDEGYHDAVFSRIAVEVRNAMDDASDIGDAMDDASDIGDAKSNVEFIKTNLGIQQSIVYSASMLLEPLELFKERVRSDNQLSAENPEVKEELLDLIDRLLQHMRFLIDRIPLDIGAEHSEKIDETASWANETYVKTIEEFNQYCSPDSISQIIAPTSITLGLGVIGSVFGGAAGFAAGTFVGNVVTRNAKPKELSDKVNASIGNSDA